MKSNFLVVLAVTLHFSAFGQIGMNASGNVGIGTVTNPQARLELEDQQFLMFNTHANSSGILFHETGGKTGNSIQYGGMMVYNESNDALVLGSYNNWTSLSSLWINRSGGIGIGYNLWGTTYKLKVHGPCTDNGKYMGNFRYTI